MRSLLFPLGMPLDSYDALICPTFAVPALAAEWDYGDHLEGGPTLTGWT